MATYLDPDRARSLEVVPFPDRSDASAVQAIPLRAARAMSWMIAVLMVGVSIAGLFVHGLYHDGAWGREAIRGGDLVTLVVVAPMLIASLILARRGSRRAETVWIGTLTYAAYDYAYYAFGAHFNDAFLAHIALVSLSVFALACALPNANAAGIADRLRNPRTSRWVGVMLVVVGALQGLLWVFVLIRNAITGEVIEEIPVAGQHLVLALDLGFLVPGLILAGVLLFRGTPMGYVLGAAMAVMGAAYQLNMLVGSAFQANAHVAGITAFPPEGVFLTGVFVIAATAVVRGARRRAGPPAAASPMS